MASGEALAGKSNAWDELTTGTTGEDAPVEVCISPRLHLPNRRIRDPYVRWCGRGEAVRPLPIPIDMTSDVKSSRKHSQSVVCMVMSPR